MEHGGAFVSWELFLNNENNGGFFCFIPTRHSRLESRAAPGFVHGTHTHTHTRDTRIMQKDNNAKIYLGTFGCDASSLLSSSIGPDLRSMTSAVILSLLPLPLATCTSRSAPSYRHIENPQLKMVKITTPSTRKSPAHCVR